MLTGSCLCGTVRYEVSGPFKWMAHCHCSRCRKHHGTLCGTSLGADPSNFHWLSGTEDIAHYRSSPSVVRSFCKHCGSTVPAAGDFAVVIPAGTLQADPGIKPQAHIFVKAKSPMCDIDDDLPKFDEYPPGVGTPVADALEPAGDDRVTTGSCLCGEVAYALDETPHKVVHCHCTRCQRSRGTAHATNVFVRQENLRWTRGADRVVAYKLPEAQLFATAFCASCGSLLPALFAGIKRYNIPVGSLDRPLDAKPRLHIYASSRASWHTIADSLPQFDEMPPRDQVKELMF